LIVKGLNVMRGYLGEPGKTREAIRDGWYLTGDIARIDPDGFVQLVDRQSRFSKIGGEMVPHVLIEEKLHERAGSSEPAFVVIGVPDEKRGERLVVLYTPGEDGTQPDVEALYRGLQATDWPKLWIPAKEDFLPIETIPLLGSGKPDIEHLKALAKDRLAGR